MLSDWNCQACSGKVKAKALGKFDCAIYPGMHYEPLILSPDRKEVEKKKESTGMC